MTFVLWVACWLISLRDKDNLKAFQNRDFQQDVMVSLLRLPEHPLAISSVHQVGISSDYRKHYLT